VTHQGVWDNGHRDKRFTFRQSGVRSVHFKFVNIHTLARHASNGKFSSMFLLPESKWELIFFVKLLPAIYSLLRAARGSSTWVGLRYVSPAFCSPL
jgi:hypothetical protein